MKSYPVAARIAVLTLVVVAAAGTMQAPLGHQNTIRKNRTMLLAKQSKE